MKEYKLIQTFRLFKTLNISSIVPFVSHGELCILKAIEQGNNEKAESIKISKLAEDLQLAPPSVSRSLNALENKNYVKRVIGSDDRRNTYVELTEEGACVLRQADEILEDFAESIANQMGKDELNKLNEYFIRLYNISKKEIELRKLETRRENK